MGNYTKLSEFIFGIVAIVAFTTGITLLLSEMMESCSKCELVDKNEHLLVLKCGRHNEIAIPNIVRKDF